MQLHTQHAHVHRVSNHDADEMGFLRLTDTEDTTESLLFYGVVPPEIQRNAAVCPGEVEPLADMLVANKLKSMSQGRSGHSK